MDHFRAAFERRIAFEMSGLGPVLKERIAEMCRETEASVRSTAQEIRRKLDHEVSKPDPNALVVDAYRKLLESCEARLPAQA